MPRGGARPGAGRKKAPGLTQRVMIRLSEETWEKVKAQAKKEGLTPSEIIRQKFEKTLEETMTATTKTTMLMNPATGSVASEDEWRDDFADIAPEDRPDVWGGPDFEDGGLIEVVPNIEGQTGYDPRYGEWRPAN